MNLNHEFKSKSELINFKMSNEEEEKEVLKEKESASINIEPKYENFKQDLNFDFVSKKDFFDELFFKQSRLFKM